MGAWKIYAFICCIMWSVVNCTFVYANGNKKIPEIINMNAFWKYSKGDHEHAEQEDFDDTSWENVGLPHSFSIPYFMSKDFYVGYGWYRKQIQLSAADLKRKLFLEFDGVFQEAEVFVNGRMAGKHVGGYTGFSVDVSPWIKKGKNLIAVRVNNLWKPDVAPRAGEHVFSGGIYRNVRLVKKEYCYISWYGTFVTTPDLAEQQGRCSRVKIETEICNESNKSGIYRLQTRILDCNGKNVATVETTETVAAGGKKIFMQLTNPVDYPALWSPQHPNLYTAVSLVYHNDRLIDSLETSFGFRWFEWTADKGFFLNGDHFYIRGANVHQDQAGWGDAVTEAAMYRDVNMIKEAGFNLIRGSHYPHAPAFSQACDETGLLFWSEAPFWGIGGFKPDGYWNSSAYPVEKKYEQAFEESALQQLREMIRIHRNHPSIVAWSMCNEAFFSAPEAMTGVRRLLKRMVDLAHQLDATRPAAVGGAQRPLADERIDRIGDLAGYNGDGATQPDFQNPGIPNLVSEYGSVTADRPGEYAPGWGDLQRDEGWKGRSWRSGQAIWCGFDHGSIAGSALGKMGIVDYFRIPKRSWYWYRNEYAGIAPPEWPGKDNPARLKLKASKIKGVKTDGTDDVQLWLTVCDASGKAVSSTPAVDLKVISGPGEFPTGRSIRFEEGSDIRIMDGQAAISFRSYYAGKTVIEASADGLEKSRIEIEFVGDKVYREGVTPIVSYRPYVRFVREQVMSELQTFGRNNPVFASSSKEGHAPGMAADGNPDTYWEAVGSDVTPYWILDTEKRLILKEIRLCVPFEKCGGYTIEVSDDKKNWRTLCNSSQVNRNKDIHWFTFENSNDRGRFVRILFTDTKAFLSEFLVKGYVCE